MYEKAPVVPAGPPLARMRNPTRLVATLVAGAIGKICHVIAYPKFTGGVYDATTDCTYWENACKKGTSTDADPSKGTAEMTDATVVIVTDESGGAKGNDWNGMVLSFFLATIRAR